MNEGKAAKGRGAQAERYWGQPAHILAGHSLVTPLAGRGGGSPCSRCRCNTSSHPRQLLALLLVAAVAVEASAHRGTQRVASVADAGARLAHTLVAILTREVAGDAEKPSLWQTINRTAGWRVERAHNDGAFPRPLRLQAMMCEAALGGGSVEEG